LIDINTESSAASEPLVQIIGRRKRLSDVQDPPAAPAPQPKPQRRRLSETDTVSRDESAPPSVPAPAQPGLVDIRSETAVLEQPQVVCATEENDARTETAAPMGQRDVKLWIAEQRCRQSLSVSAAGGLLAAIVGALAWAAVSAVANAPVIWMSVGMGALVGGAIRVLGRGVDRSFGVLGAGLTLFACILGNCLANGTFVARDVGLSVTSLLTQISPHSLPRLIAATFHPADVLFYALALCLGYRFSFRRIARPQVSHVPAKA
jgi:hypothetical protein